MKAFFTTLFVVSLLVIVGGFMLIVNFSTEKMDTFNGQLEKNYFFGKLVAERNYESDKLEGITKIYYNNGNLKSQWQFKQGKRHGMAIHYDSQGNVKYRDKYVKGQRVLRRVYDLQGNLVKEKEYK